MSEIPIYSLYGEERGAVAAGWLHAESIPARSRLHDFEIAPHRHEHLFQLLHMTAGSGSVLIDGAYHDMRPGDIALLPAWTVHAFRFSANVDGVVVTLRERDLAEGGLALPKAQVVMASVSLQQALADLVSEADQFAVGYDLAMRARIALLLVALVREAGPETEAIAPPVRAKADQFQELVNQKFRETRSVADYAEALGMSQTHLGRISRAAFSASPLAVIEGRIALEARRLLLFSSLPIKEIAEGLGYEDPAYFARVMTKLLGVAPSVLRAERHDLNGPLSQHLAKSE